MKSTSRHRWFVFGVFFVFMLLHQADKLLIGSLVTPIMQTYHINEAQMGAVATGALVMAGVFYPLWGYWYDRFARAKLIALAAFIWGSTTWLSAIAPTYGWFVATRASTGIDDSSYPGLYSLLADYFEPRIRGKVYGFLQISEPFGYLLGMLLATLLREQVGWRGVFYITGSVGIVLAVIILLSVREPPRGKSEPEMAALEQIRDYHFDWKVAQDLLRKPSLRLLYLQGFFGVFPWNVIQLWFFRYLETERGYSGGQALTTMAIAVLVLSAGYPLAGALGDWLFKRTPRGRLLVSTVGVILGAVLLVITLRVPVTNPGLFQAMLALTALFIPFASPNVASTVFDITLPEVRSTSMALQNFIETVGAALAPLVAGLIAVRASLGTAILVLCFSAWCVCGVAFTLATWVVPRDIATLRQQMRQRADLERIGEST
jgi:MFS family permease